MNTKKHTTLSNQKNRGRSNYKDRSGRKNDRISTRRSSKKSSFKRGGRSKQPHFDPSQFINNSSLNINVVEDQFFPKHTFLEFGLSKPLTDALERLKIKIPTPIQDKVIPEILKGNDVVGLAETGTGKTAAFILPLLEKSFQMRNKQTLVVTPTRELASQIEAELKLFGHGSGITSVLCVGGAGIRPQISKLERKPNFVIGTPGRLIDLINRGILKPEVITAVVLDEADRMLDMGFINDIKAILKNIPTTRETHLFSATMPKMARELIHDFLNDPVEISVKKKDTIDGIDQGVIFFTQENKFKKLIETLEDINKGRIIIFGEMKYGVEKLSKQLKSVGFSADSIHGNKTHSQRKRALDRFKNGQTSILVATDVAARGLHIDNVTHVINYDLPNTFEDYIHRIGRTGRAHKKGKALTFVPENKLKRQR